MSLPEVRLNGVAKTPADNAPKLIEHEVRLHQTLGSIAKHYNVTLDELLAANPQFDRAKLNVPKPTRREGATGRNPNLIHPGEKVHVPRREQSPRTSKPKPEAAPGDQYQASAGATGGQSTQETAPQKALAPEKQTPPAAAQPPPAADQGPDGSKPRAENAKESAAATGEAKDKDKAKEKGGGVWGFLKSLFASPLFQGLMAVLGAIPGVGQFVSALGAVVNLTLFIASAVSGKPDWTMLASAAVFTAGIFAPGVGAFGGLLGLAATLDPAKQRAGRTQRNDEQPKASREAQQAEQNRETRLAMDAPEVDAALARVRPAGAIFASPEVPETWARDVAALAAEYRRLQALPAAERDAARLEQLAAYFNEELPRALMTGGLALAYGDALKTPPAPGSLLPGGPAQPLAAIAKNAVAAADRTLSEAEVLAAIRAYNGLPNEATTTTPGMPLFIPTEDLVRAYAQDPQKSLYLAAQEPKQRRAAGLAVLPTIASSELAAEIKRLWGVIAKMNVRPRTYEVAWNAAAHDQAHDHA